MRYLFKHVLMRDAVYDMQLRRYLRTMHRKAAEAIEELHADDLASYYADLAFHYENAGIEEKAIEYLHKAGDYAKETYAVGQAIGYYQRALALLEEVSQVSGERVCAHSSVWARWMELYAGLGQMLWWQTRYTEAIEAYEAMRATAEAAGDAVTQARAWDSLGNVYDSQGDYQAALGSAKRAEEIARRADAQVELALAVFGKGWALMRLGHAKAALALGEEALALGLELVPRAPHVVARSQNLIGIAYKMLGQYDQSIHYQKSALESFRESGDRRRVTGMLNNLGETARVRGDYCAAVALYQDALANAREIGDRDWEMVFLCNLGGARVGLGEYRAAEADLRQVIHMARSITWLALSETHRFLAEACLGQGKIKEALAAARRALKLAQETEAREFTGAAWRILGMVVAELPESVAAGKDVYDAAACFAGSLRIFTEMGAEGERARTLRAWARYEIEKGDREHGETMWQEAQEIFERLGMAPEVERMEQGEELDGGR